MATAGEPNDEDDEPNDIDREISELRSAKKEIFEIIKPFTDEPEKIAQRERECIDIYTHTRARARTHTHTHTHTRLAAFFPGLGLNQDFSEARDSEWQWHRISWAICKSAHCSRETTTPASHHSVIYTPDALLSAKPTASKH